MMKEDPVNKLTLQSPEDIEFALAGLYHQFAELNNNDLCMTLLINRDDFAWINSHFYGEDCTRGGGSESPDENMLLSAYAPLYKSIACANDIFKKTKNFNHQDTKIQNLLGEVYFMRAYCYFWLVRLYGQIPIIDNVDVNYSVPKSTYTEIYIFIESDLQRAISLLPNSNYTARKKYVTPHRGSAKALLAEVYLNWAGYPVKDVSMYAKSASIAKEVIDSADYFGLGLVTDLADLWNGQHDLNQESVFSIYASYANLFGITEDELFVGNDFDPTDIYFWLGWYGAPEVGIKFYNAFPNNYRKKITFMEGNKDINRISSIDACSEMHFRKYWLQYPRIKVIYLLRYSHTLLTYAEAKARSGYIDHLAYEAVNQIRRRANKVDQNSPSVYDISQELSTEKFAESVVWERAWEFCNEPESRWFDLVRLEMAANLKNLKDRNDGATFPRPPDMKTYFYPIPKTDLMLNLELK
jgi:hypothetical protein